MAGAPVWVPVGEPLPVFAAGEGAGLTGFVVVGVGAPPPVAVPVFTGVVEAAGKVVIGVGASGNGFERADATNEFSAF